MAAMSISDGALGIDWFQQLETTYIVLIYIHFFSHCDFLTKGFQTATFCTCPHNSVKDRLGTFFPDDFYSNHLLFKTV